jgi:hypothetical protein
MDQISTRPGESYDTYTDCPSFDAASGDGQVRRGVRDTIGKD